MNQFEFDARSVAAAAITRRPFAFNEWRRQWPPHTDELVRSGIAQMIITIWWKQQQRKGENCWMKKKWEWLWHWKSKWKCRARKCKCCLSIGTPIFSASGNTKHQTCPNSFTNIWLCLSLCLGKAICISPPFLWQWQKGNDDSVDEL